MTDESEEFPEVLRRAGLEVVADPRVEGVLPPQAAWHPVVAFEAEPAVTVRHDRPDPVAELNAQWHRLAVEYGVVGEDGVFLLHAPLKGAGKGHWTQVRLTADWDLAGVLAERPGQPEFLTLSPDGEALLGVTTEEYDVWIVAVDRLGERR
ncbi:hypothetical protein CTZ27_10755 [Streptomyces griseocarneus]|nr:hypothetical protein CTZ27_10755 [Streptomyces griseocarneus]